MASIGSRLESRSRVGDGPRTKRMGGVMETSKEDFSPALTRNARREADNTRIGAQSRIPQNSSARKPVSSPSTRPPLTHESRSWNSLNSDSSRSTTTALGPSSLPTRDRSIGSPHPRNVLRRKQSGVSQDTTGLRSNSGTDSGRTSSSSSIPRSQTSVDPYGPYSDRSITESPVEIQIAQRYELPRAVAQSTTLYPELDRYRDIKIPRDEPGAELLFRLATHDLPPPTPLFSGTSSHSQLSTFSGSPSTRFSDSPGPGPYSRDTTPTSMSSVSPGLIAPIRNPATRIKQASPAETRPPVTRRRGSLPTEDDAFGLAVVREALTSSSSNSTVRDGDERAVKKKKGLSPFPPNPPPRKSSQKHSNDRDDVASPSKPARQPAQLVMKSPSPVKSKQKIREKDQRAVTSPQPRATPPSRPSREGTPDLYSQFGGPMPIIHSNLSATSMSDRRQSGQLAPSSLPRSTTPSSSKDHAVPSKLPVSREPTPAPRSSTSVNPPTNKGESGRTTRTPSPSISAFKSGFGLFSRRTKTEPDIPQLEKKERGPRKGPAAGTGHEGYGRIGAVKRRSGSLTSPRGLAGPASLSDSASNQQSADQFFLDRMNPVVISGGEIVENRNASSELSRTESNQSLLPVYRPSIDSRNGSSASLSSREDARTTLWPSPFPRDSIRSRRPSDSSDSEAVVMKSTLAYRRSVQRLRSSPDQQPLNLPKPIMTRGITSPSIGSIDTSILTDDSMVDSRPELKRGQTGASIGPKKLIKRPKSPRKWNPFSRSQNQSTDALNKKGQKSAKAPPSKPVAFYTIMDSSEQEDIEEQDMKDILRDAEVFAPPPPAISGRQRQPYVSGPRIEPQPVPPPAPQATITNETRNTSLPAKTRQSRPIEAKPVKGASAQAQAPAKIGRPSRLPQVGRIPKVVNTRPEQTSPKSFSRPFHRISLQMPPPQLTTLDGASVAKGPSPTHPLTPELSRDSSTVTTGASNSPPQDQSLRQNHSLDLEQTGKEFLAFSPRFNSQCTASSTSSSSGVLSYAQTAVIPGPAAPLAEDEIWDEYNDLLGDVPPSATSSKGVPFHLETYETRFAKKVGKPLESPTINIQNAKDIRGSIEAGKAATSSSHFSADMTARINAAFRFGSEPPSTPFSVTEFVSGYGDRNNSVDLSKAIASSQRSSFGSNKSRRTRVSNSSSASEETPLSQVNLRVGSMTVSKWLTFGHVLFSPVREELVPVVGSLKRHSILVIDGLGNDDWSFYAAETYPAATFFNLSPRAPLSQEHRTSTSFPLSPPNHHQIQYTSHLNKFPFGPDSFTSVVFRFPSAAPEAHYRNIISEARRVLKPGGYIELSILDADLNNMGNRSRRAVRRLKESVSTRHPDINLSSTADLMLRLLGKKGFVDVKTCRVGVPVASAITSIPGREGGNEKEKKKRKKDERSLAEMMNDDTEMGDENITKMVAKVGRWWYSRLYETPTGVSGSIWNDRALMAECEEWKTSLKLMVCHAKMPETRSRVSSI